MIRPDEPELGEQRQCVLCREWWPEAEEFYAPNSSEGRRYLSRRCRACDRDRQRQAERRWRQRRRTAA